LSGEGEAEAAAPPAPARPRKGLLREALEAALLAVLAALAVRLFAAEVYRIPSGSMVPALEVGDQILVWKLGYGLRHPWAERFVVELDVPRRGDVVVFRHPREAGKDYVKRVVGLPGDVVELREGALFVNGVAQPREPDGEAVYGEPSERTGRWWSDTCARFREELAAGPVAPPADGSPEAARDAWRAAAAHGTRRHAVLQCRRPQPGEREGPYARVDPGHVFVVGDNRDRSHDSRAGGGWQVPLTHVRGRAVLVLWRFARGGPEGLRLDRLFKPVE